MSGNIWLDPTKTSPYKFYQFWLNTTDVDADKYIKIFTLLTKEEVEKLAAEQAEAPHLRPLQKRLAQEITIMIHGEEAYNAAVEASQILFGKGTNDTITKMDNDTLLSVFEGVPQFEISKEVVKNGISAVDLLSIESQVFPSKGEFRRTVDVGGLSINKLKIEGADTMIDGSWLINDALILVQKGKKNYYLLNAK